MDKNRMTKADKIRLLEDVAAGRKTIEDLKEPNAFMLTFDAKVPEEERVYTGPDGRQYTKSDINEIAARKSVSAVYLIPDNGRDKMNNQDGTQG